MFVSVSRLLFLAATVAVISGCFPQVIASSAIVTKRLQMVSAGHTGCVPDENAITKVTMIPDGSGTWYATCKSKTYLCSAVGSVGGSESFSCAPLAQ